MEEKRNRELRNVLDIEQGSTYFSLSDLMSRSSEQLLKIFFEDTIKLIFVEYA